MGYLQKIYMRYGLLKETYMRYGLLKETYMRNLNCLVEREMVTITLYLNCFMYCLDLKLLVS